MIAAKLVENRPGRVSLSTAHFIQYEIIYGGELGSRYSSQRKRRFSMSFVANLMWYN